MRSSPEGKAMSAGASILLSDLQELSVLCYELHRPGMEPIQIYLVGHGETLQARRPLATFSKPT